MVLVNVVKSEVSEVSATFPPPNRYDGFMQNTSIRTPTELVTLQIDVWLSTKVSRNFMDTMELVDILLDIRNTLNPRLHSDRTTNSPKIPELEPVQ